MLFASIVMESFKNIFSNYFGKKGLNTFSDAVFFNILACLGAVIFFLICSFNFQISTFSFIMAIIFSVSSSGALLFSLLAMATGPMSYSLLFTYMGMIIPTVYGIIYFNQPVKAVQIVGFLLMIATVYLGVAQKEENKISVKWLLYAILSFITNGSLGIVQQVHQSSSYAHEANVFMLWTYILATLISIVVFMFVRKEDRKKSLSIVKTKMTVLGLFAGVLFGAVNVINLLLSVKLPSILFFPVVNGGVLVFSTVAAIFFFKEKPNRMQTIGIVTGIIAVCLLGL